MPISDTSFTKKAFFRDLERDMIRKQADPGVVTTSIGGYVPTSNAAAAAYTSCVSTGATSYSGDALASLTGGFNE